MEMHCATRQPSCRETGISPSRGFWSLETTALEVECHSKMSGRCRKPEWLHSSSEEIARLSKRRRLDGRLMTALADNKRGLRETVSLGGGHQVWRAVQCVNHPLTLVRGNGDDRFRVRTIFQGLKDYVCNLCTTSCTCISANMWCTFWAEARPR